MLAYNFTRRQFFQIKSRIYHDNVTTWQKLLPLTIHLWLAAYLLLSLLTDKPLFGLLDFYQEMFVYPRKFTYLCRTKRKPTDITT